eukprot:augustus_masked-scaffold_2-processed-gene-17.48-mRNA-1 protein AED:1.00 eAED:1.00 QI:0/0/0/0/1/1/3/0/523
MTPTADKTAKRTDNTPDAINAELEILTTLDREPLLSFIIRFKRARQKDPSLEIAEWLGGTVSYKIQSHEIDLNNTSEVLKHLESIERMRAESLFVHSIGRLSSELKWPTNTESGIESIRHFIIQAKEILGPERSLNPQSHKAVIKNIVKKLPGYFQKNDTNYLDLFPKVSILDDFAQSLELLAHIEDAEIRKKRNDSALTLHTANLSANLDHTPSPSPTSQNLTLISENPVERVILALNRLETKLDNINRCFNCGATDHFIANCPEQRQVGSMSTPQRQSYVQASGQNTNPRSTRRQSNRRTMAQRKMPVMQPRADPVEFLELMDGPNWLKVKGILDSGAAKTIENVRHHNRFCCMLHPVQSNLSVQLAKYEPIPIALIGDAEIRVKIDDDEPVYLGRVGIMREDVPSITFFGGDGPNLQVKKQQEQIRSYLEKQLKESKVITEAERQMLLDTSLTHISSFGHHQGARKVSQLTPVTCHLVPSAPPGIFLKPRPIGQKEEIWLKNRIDELMEARILKRLSDPV